jgi:putative transposase
VPRANRTILAGHTYHVTHRCHDRAFLLRFARDRQAYRHWVRDSLPRWEVDLLTYCITSNHVHLLVKATDTDQLAAFMQRVAGGMAQAYNLRKRRSGAFWSDRYHAAMVEDGEHLWRCMRYIDLNMVRAGRVAHPSEWDWTGWAELMGERKRNKLLNMDALLAALDVSTAAEFRKQHRDAIADSLAHGPGVREPWWSESVAVGSAEFTATIERRLRADYTRRHLESNQTDTGLWTIRETAQMPYGP